MAREISSNVIDTFRNALDTHPVYAAVSSIEDLRCFMEHHVYSVWDFMSLIKYLQSIIAPATYPWVPRGDDDVRRFINELVLEEETDESVVPGAFSSHFDLYRRAMQEVGANTAPVSEFVERVREQGVEQAMATAGVPVPSRRFTLQTFRFIHSGKPHQVAAALALGREHIIPSMFRSILGQMSVSEHQAPTFHFYLKRHVHLDEDFHAPLSLKLLNKLCAGDANRVGEAVEAARVAVAARTEFWDGVLEAIRSRRG